MFDLYGSTSEWCSDGAFESFESFAGTIEIGMWLTRQLGNKFNYSRVLRGGSFYYVNPDGLRSAYRDSISPANRDIVSGFRFSRTK
jgi:formylglycine-generating enzyme required for sulfatase activity